MLQAAIFDVGGVLVESPFVAALRWQVELQLPDSTLGVFFAEYAKVPEPGEEPPMWHRVEMGQVSVQDFLDRVKPQLRGLIPDDHIVFSLRADEFNVFANAGAHWEMVDLVRRLRAAGVATAILTNNVREWAAWRQVIPLDIFDVLVDSCEVGLRKPDPAIWALTLDRLGVAASAAMFADDHPTNVAAARQMGMAGVDVGPDFGLAISQIDELFGLGGAGVVEL